MKARLRLFVSTVLVMGLATAQSATINWTNTAGGNWSAAANWSPNQVPAGSDSAVIGAAGSYTVALDVNATVGSLALGASSGTQTLNVTANNLTLTLNNPSSINTNGVVTMSASTI